MSPANNKSTFIPYSPGSPPVLDNPREITRAVWDELIRIQQSLVDLDRPVTITCGGSDTLVATASGQTYARLFDASPQIIYEKPGGSFNPASGVYTAPQEGIYQVYCRMNVPAFPSPQTKTYTGYVRFTMNKASSGTEVFYLEDGGFDDTILTVQGMTLTPLYQGDTITFDGAITRAAGGGNIIVTSHFNILRVSGLA